MSDNSSGVTATLIAPLPDLSGDDLPDGSYQLGNDLALVSSPRVELDAGHVSQIGEQDYHGIVRSRWALQLTYDADLQVLLGQLEEDAIAKIMYAAMALWIIKPNCCGIHALLIFRSDSVDGAARSVTRYANPIRILDGHSADGLNVDDISSLQTVVRRLEQGRVAKNRLDRALIYLNAGLRSEHGYPRVAMLTTVFECLLVNENQELAHRVSERYAWLLGTDATERQELYRSMKSFYSLRSSIVHGQGFSRKAEVDLDVSGVQIEIAVQRVFRRILLDESVWPKFTSDNEWRAFMDALPFG